MATYTRPYIPSLSPEEENTRARMYIDSLLQGSSIDPMRPDMGIWEIAVQKLDECMQSGLDIQAMLDAFIASGRYPGLADLLLDIPPIPPAPCIEKDDMGMPELPYSCKMNEVEASEASPILDDIISFFRYWCTRSYEGYYEATAIWLLSTIAARRVKLNWRQGVWTPLYIMLVSETGAYAKTEAPKYAKQILKECGLSFLLVPNETTPQKFISNMAGKSLPRDYDRLDRPKQDFIRQKIAFSGQKGWISDEFGDKLREVVQSKGGHQGLFYALLKQLYDCQDLYEYDTHARSNEVADMPYLTLIGTATPACLQPIAQYDSPIWTDGTFGRFAFVVPPKDSMKTKLAPMEMALIPDSIKDALTDWHERLGMPECDIVERELMDEAGGSGDTKKKRGPSAAPEYDIIRGDLPQSPLPFTTPIYDALQVYTDSLAHLALELDKRFKSAYVRLPEMALRIAMLLASLQGYHEIGMQHWARGQQIAEHWRANFHELIAQLSAPSETEALQNYGQTEDRILAVLATSEKPLTARDVSRMTRPLRRLGTPKTREFLDDLAASGTIVKEGKGRQALYLLKKEGIAV